MCKKNTNMPILSICIPTYNRTDILRTTLNSIFSQGVDESLFEVCVSDDSPLSDTEEMIKKEFSKYANLVYQKIVCSESFINCFEVLKMGKGSFLKLCNDTSCFQQGALSRMVESIGAVCSQTPVVFFTMNDTADVAAKKYFQSFDAFLFELSYMSTWAAGFGIWRADFKRFLQDDFDIEEMFPHTSMLFSMTDTQEYLIDTYKYIETLIPNKKGGYNLPEVFAVKYTGMLQKLYDEHKISPQTLQKIKTAVLEFIADWAVTVQFEPNRYTFDFSNVQEHIVTSFGEDGYSHYLELVKKKIEKRQAPLLEKKSLVENHVSKILQDKGIRPLYVWGIGRNAVIVEEVLNTHGIKIDGYIDRLGGEGIERNGLPVRICDDVLPNKVYVVVSMGRIDSEVSGKLKQFGYDDFDFQCVFSNSMAEK